VGILFQHLHLLPDLSMCDNILLPLVPRRISRSEKTERLGLLLEALALSALIDVPVQQLSGGQRQRAAMARAMISAPRYLLLDEPTSFQDDATVQSLVLYWQQAAQEGACVVICSHDLRLRRNGQIQQRFSLAQGALTRIA
jgi:ABC-type lipoprotein export system ATPase subunit